MTKGLIIPSFHIDAFILKATLKAEWINENELERPSTDKDPAQVEKLVLKMDENFHNVANMMKLCGIVRRKTMQDSYIAPALAEGAIERKYPNQIHRPDQMYRLTEQAKAWKEWQEKKNT